MKKTISVAAFGAIFMALSISAFAQSATRDDLLKQIEVKRAELAQLEKQILEPSEEDKISVADFLKHPDTGLIRLLPREKYDDQAYRDRARSGLTIRGGGAYYSFSQRSHDYNSGSPDLSLEMGELSVGFAGANYGMLTNLGDVPIETLAIENPSVLFMSQYSAPQEEPEARAEARRFGEGANIGGTLYRDRLPAKVNSTYMLRSINYAASDVLVAFRVIRRDTDGSLILVWKILRNYPRPKLARGN